MTERIILPSGDVQAEGDRAIYTIPLNPPLVLDGDDNSWEVGLVSATFPHPGGGNSVVIGCSLCEQSRVGSQQLPLLFRVEPTATAIPYRAVQEGLIVWSNVRGTYHSQVTVSLTYGLNVPIPAAADPAYDFTTVEVVLRRRTQ